MRSNTVVFVGAALAAAMMGVLVSAGASGVTVAFLAILSALGVSWAGSSMRSPQDWDWLPKWVMLGFAAKLAGTLVRYYMVAFYYGYGDAMGYYRTGTELAMVWRSGRVPSLTGHGGLGTQVTDAVTGALFAIITPDILGGFVMFAILAYLGQLLLYAAFRRHASPGQLKPYFIMIALFPTYAFWPSSLGKDALVLFGLGLAAYFVSRSLETFEVRWLLGMAVALAGIGFIRIHIAGLVVAAMIVATLISKRPPVESPGLALRRLLVLAGGVGAALAVITLLPNIWDIDLLSSQDRDQFTTGIAEQTSKRGTVVEGEPADSLVDLPAALAHVLYRPFIFEASELQHYLAALETTAIAALTIWRLPGLLRNLGRWRANPYMVFSTVYLFAFAFAFSAIRNLGIIARQRGQVLAFFLCLLVGLSWEEPEDDEADHTPEPLTAVGGSSLSVSSAPTRGETRPTASV